MLECLRDVLLRLDLDLDLDLRLDLDLDLFLDLERDDELDEVDLLGRIFLLLEVERLRRRLLKFVGSFRLDSGNSGRLQFSCRNFFNLAPNFTLSAYEGLTGTCGSSSSPNEVINVIFPELSGDGDRDSDLSCISTAKDGLSFAA